MKITPRQAAVNALMRVEQGSYSNLVLEAYAKEENPSPQERAFAQALLYGVLERRLTLDHILSGYSKVPVGKMEPEIRAILRCALYQLAYMDTPDSAAVNEAVGLVKATPRLAFNPRLSGFVNGVLRGYLRADKAFPPLKGGWEERLSVETACPRPMLRLYVEALGKKGAEDFLRHSLTVSPNYLRVNTKRTTDAELIQWLAEDDIPAAPDPLVPHCLAVGRHKSLQNTNQWEQGFFHLQDKSSQLCVLALDAQPDQRVLDVCAAPGGKAFTAAQMMEDTGRIVAMDVHENRVKLIRRGASALGLDCIYAMQGDATQPGLNMGEFDRILCDVPCSGLGVIRRKPEIKYKNPEEFENLPSIQYKILETSANYLKEGGRLVYSTCTLNPKENTEVVDRFLAEHPDFESDTLPEALGGGASRLIAHELDSDGFFIAVLKKRMA
ncbi:16S rRNA (cytosine(967)-C(5))-methyltransferase RsmB [Oscillospiraceae bacterium MB08-C2-2]|nr:16S rRNA (cytosine(967)-C(5))-methyltransferase RsmB [Oscillospiraceae bacterium MB08-C2-2]